MAVYIVNQTLSKIDFFPSLSEANSILTQLFAFSSPLRMRKRVTVVCLCVCVSFTGLTARVLIPVVDNIGIGINT